MKRKLRKISALTVIAAVAFLSFSNWKLIYATVAGDCYMNIGGSKILLKGITNKCYIQSYGSENLEVLLSDTHLHFTICGSYRDDDTSWGYNFIHFSKGNPEPYRSANWPEVCARDEGDLLDVQKWGYNPSAISSYAVPVTYDEDGNMIGIDENVEREIMSSFETAEHHIVTRMGLNDLVRSYRFPKND